MSDWKKHSRFQNKAFHGLKGFADELAKKEAGSAADPPKAPLDIGRQKTKAALRGGELTDLVELSRLMDQVPDGPEKRVIDETHSSPAQLQMRDNAEFEGIRSRVREKALRVSGSTGGNLKLSAENLDTIEPLDLHGESVEEAIRLVTGYLRGNRGRCVEIITGRGLHSEGEPKIKNAVRDLLQREMCRAGGLVVKFNESSLPKAARRRNAKNKESGGFYVEVSGY